MNNAREMLKYHKKLYFGFSRNSKVSKRYIWASVEKRSYQDVWVAELYLPDNHWNNKNIRWAT